MHEKLLPIPGYTPKHNYSNTEIMRKAKMGV